MASAFPPRGDFRSKAQWQDHKRFASIGLDDKDVPVLEPGVNLREPAGARLCLDDEIEAYDLGG